MKILLTGAAGFIGMHTALRLLSQGYQVVGVDNLNDYYPVQLKHDRLAQLTTQQGFHFLQADCADWPSMQAVIRQYGTPDAIIHLAAQAGVRYSLQNPFAYTHSNVDGQLVMLELMRQYAIPQGIYASSSSVYGANDTRPYRPTDHVDHPVSLYAATKRAGELMAESYRHLYQLSLTGLRFFTVYGPWGRPDMAPWKFTRAILAGEAIEVYNHGRMKRDFTYITDIVEGIMGALHQPAAPNSHRLYNLGNHQSVDLLRFIAAIEQATGRQATKHFFPLQPGDVLETYADITDSQRDLGFHPHISIEEGMAQFVQWFRQYHAMI